METSAQKQAGSKGPVIATVYKPPGAASEKKKPGEYPGGFEEENFFPGKRQPKPGIRNGDPELGGGDGASSRPVYKPLGAGKKPKARDYGKDSQDLETLIERYISELQKYLKGKDIQAGIVFMPYSRN